jgi:cytochrome c oxidase subunit 2
MVGPDLTHVGSRMSIGAALVDNDREDFEHWIAHVSEIKPEVRMPAFAMLSNDRIRDLAAYLEGLQ